MLLLKKPNFCDRAGTGLDDELPGKRLEAQILCRHDWGVIKIGDSCIIHMREHCLESNHPSPPPHVRVQFGRTVFTLPQMPVTGTLFLSKVTNVPLCHSSFPAPCQLIAPGAIFIPALGC